VPQAPMSRATPSACRRAICLLSSHMLGTFPSAIGEIMSVSLEGAAAAAEKNVYLAVT
jgi:hypothetical protein